MGSRIPLSLCHLLSEVINGLPGSAGAFKKGGTLEVLFGQQWIDVARFNRIDRRHAQPGREIKVLTRLDDVVDFTSLPSRYSAGEQEKPLILVDLAEQFHGAYEYGLLHLLSRLSPGSQGAKLRSANFGSRTPTPPIKPAPARLKRRTSLFDAVCITGFRECGWCQFLDSRS
ncbi:MAG TPA: hypothetical protein PKW52_03720 [Nitrospira sp.]|nr:hypothetical protein [Nitrospira sp.]HQV10418.1 hypothetical protein [Nitrospira sp.]